MVGWQVYFHPIWRSWQAGRPRGVGQQTPEGLPTISSGWQPRPGNTLSQAVGMDGWPGGLGGALGPPWHTRVGARVVCQTGRQSPLGGAFARVTSSAGNGSPCLLYLFFMLFGAFYNYSLRSQLHPKLVEGLLVSKYLQLWS